MSAFDITSTLHSYLSEGGVTVDEEGVPSPHKAGYYVGGLYPSLVFKSVEEFDRGEVAWWIGTHGARYYGVWVDSEDGKVYVDAVQWCATRQNAIIIGRERNEIAVWDVRKGEEIRVTQAEA